MDKKCDCDSKSKYFDFTCKILAVGLVLAIFSLKGICIVGEHWEIYKLGKDQRDYLPSLITHMNKKLVQRQERYKSKFNNKQGATNAV